MTRRRTRPLLPSGILPALHSTQETTDAEPSSNSSADIRYRAASSQTNLSVSQDREEAGNGSIWATNSSPGSEPDNTSLTKSADPDSARVYMKAILPDAQHGDPPIVEETSPQPLLVDAGAAGESQPRQDSADLLMTSQSTGRSITSSQESAILQSHGVLHSEPNLDDLETQKEVLPSIQHLHRNSSSVRLSLSLDGKAKVVLGTGTTPSPPRKQLAPLSRSRLPSPLQRSKSLLEPKTQTSADLATSLPAWPRHRAPGRSRDARTWEFYCDSDARNALTLQAEQDQKGSALGVLGLIRSESANSKALAPSSKKHNALLKRHDSGKRKATASLGSHKPKLARTTSSVARMQSTSGDIQQKIPQTGDKDSKPGSWIALYRDASGDSDKENWVPGTQRSNNRRRQPQSQSSSVGPRAVLGENTSVVSHATDFGSTHNQSNNVARQRHKKRIGAQNKENVEVDQEVSKFMGGSSLPRGEEDLDCVQGLLSLSQGAWR